jgi:hypothetical protein
MAACSVVSAHQISFGPGPVVDRFLARDNRYTMDLSPGESALRFRTSELHMKHSDPKARAEPLEPLSAKANYFVGNDPSRWRTAVARRGQAGHPSVAGRSYPVLPPAEALHQPLIAGCRDRKLTISSGPAFRDLVCARGANGQRLLPRSFREVLDVRGGQQHWRRYQCKGKQSKLLPSGGVGLCS